MLFILHADHEQNCSTNAMRAVGSSQPDPYAAVAAAIAALYGPLHGGANEAAIRMLMEIGSVKNVPAMIKKVKAGERRLMGFGHRVYKNYDPRAKILKEIAYEVFEVTGRNPLIDIAIELERIALEDDYFISRKLYPNVDFYSGDHLPGDGLSDDDVPGAVRDSAHLGMDGAVGRDGARSGAEDRAAAPGLHRRSDAALYADKFTADAVAARGCGERSNLTSVRLFSLRRGAAVADCAIHGWPKSQFPAMGRGGIPMMSLECLIYKEATLRWARTATSHKTS